MEKIEKTPDQKIREGNKEQSNKLVTLMGGEIEDFANHGWHFADGDQKKYDDMEDQFIDKVLLVKFKSAPQTERQDVINAIKKGLKDRYDEITKKEKSRIANKEIPLAETKEQTVLKRGMGAIDKLEEKSYIKIPEEK